MADESDAPRLAGLVLAAGAGTRFGGPKALARTAHGIPWVGLAVAMLRDAGCADVFVALGAAADEAAGLVPDDATVIVVPDAGRGLSATLRAGLDAAGEAGADAVLVMPVDIPDARAEAGRRVLDAAGPNVRSRLVQAAYRGEPGHPVLIGADHFGALAASASGDRGARPYLRAHGVLEVECGDLWSGADIDAR